MVGNRMTEQSENSHSDSAIERAEAFGIDISLLESNLRLTPTERVLQLQQAANSMLRLQADAARWREQQARE
jgi:hypothetical protein